MAKADNLLRICSDFRSGILGKRPSALMCGAVSYPLQGFLSMVGYETHVVEGQCHGWQHIWLRLPDGHIIDPTADQFNKPDGSPMPAVYIGERPEWYRSA